MLYLNAMTKSITNYNFDEEGIEKYHLHVITVNGLINSDWCTVS